MGSLLPRLQDLLIEKCIPSCEQCPSFWINEQIEHRILCRCKRCNHGKVEQSMDKSGDFELPARSRQTHQEHIQTPDLVSQQQDSGVLKG
jgi:hypothetical protein